MKVSSRNRSVNLPGTESMHWGGGGKAAPVTVKTGTFQGRPKDTQLADPEKLPQANGMPRIHMLARPLEVKTHLVLAHGDLGSMAGLISRGRPSLPSGQGGSPAPRIRSYRSLAVKSYLLRHKIMTLKHVREPQGFSLKKQNTH